MPKNKVVACNIVTGFLGTGKTTTIANLLSIKPKNERWAILVNEFGEIGLDEALLASNTQSEQITIKQIPGGCLCCASGVPFQITLNMLLMKAKPDRLIIEPTGLGHPKEILNILNGPHYETVIQLQNTVTLIDPRHFSSEKYLQHPIFNQQLEVADILLVNKLDLAQEGDLETFFDYVQRHDQLNADVLLNKTETSSELYALMSTPKKVQTSSPSTIKFSLFNPQASRPLSSILQQSETIPECGYICKVHQESAYQSIGWRITNHAYFNEDQLISWLTQQDFLRAKMRVNSAKDKITVNALANECIQTNTEQQTQSETMQENLIELIFENSPLDDQDIQNITVTLLACSNLRPAS